MLGVIQNTQAQKNPAHGGVGDGGGVAYLKIGEYSRRSATAMRVSTLTQ